MHPLPCAGLAALILSLPARPQDAPAGALRGQITTDTPVPAGGAIRVFALRCHENADGRVLAPDKQAIFAAAASGSGATADGDGAFALAVDAGRWCVFAFVDLDGDGRWDPGAPEPFGWHTARPAGHWSPVSTDAAEAAAIAIAPRAPHPFPRRTRRAPHGELRTIRGRQVLQLRGNVTERGFAHGYLVGPQIVDFFRFYVLEDKTGSAERYDRGFAQFLTTHVVVPDAMARECDAVLAGMRAAHTDMRVPELGRDFCRTDLLAINAYIETRAMQTHCTQFAAWGDRTRGTDVDGGTITGRNMDGECDLRKVTVSHFLLFAVDPSEPGEKRWVSAMWPGFVGTISGLNEDGFYTMENAGGTGPGPVVDGIVPVSWTMRETLARLGADATPADVKALCDSYANSAGGSCGPGCIMLFATPFADQPDPAFVFEGDRFGDAIRRAGAVRPWLRDAILCSNHFLSYGCDPAAPGTFFGQRPGFSSQWRYEAGMHKLEAWARADRSVGTAEMRELLQTVAHGTTEYAVITRPNARELEVATASLASELWDAPYREWTKFGFDELFRQEQATGYRGVWYANQKSGDEYVYKYSGGLGTYCAKHNPFAVYCAEVDKTFFCYGGATAEQPRRLLHMVSYFDHRTGLVPRPTILLDKQTTDAHDNPVIAVDGEGYVWIFSTSHGRARPSYVHRSAAPYSIDAFEAVPATYETDSGERAPLDNFSYLQVWHLQDRGFVAFFTHYNDPAARTSMFMTSTDGVQWSRWQRLAAIEEGHYQISAVHRAADGGATAATACNYHPAGKGLNFRTNLYYLATDDLGATWHAADGQPVAVPLTTVDSPALVHDYAGEGLNVYLKDLRFDSEGRPILVFVTSRGYESGPANGPRQWRCARWTGERWDIAEIAASDNNYDMGSLLLDSDTDWRLIAPTEPGPQPFNPGGEVAVHSTVDGGASWQRSRVLTAGSDRNHTYVRRPVGAAPGMQAFWADGHGRRPSESRLYFCDRAGTVFELPREMAEEFARPLPRGPLAWAEDFADPASGDAFVFSDPNAWRRDDGGWLELHRQSDYAPAHRSPLNLAILRTPAVGSFVLELEMQQTGRDYGHRDLCVFFGVQDPEHFYYAHLATAADPNAHHVQIVDAAARRPVTTARSGGVDWGRDVWRCVRVERDVASGSVRVYFDNALEPVLEAADTTFGRGFVGFGSFDDTGRVRRVRLWSTDVDPERTFAGFSSAR